MGGVKLVIRKYMSFKGREEEFSNVYYFGNGGVASVSNSEAEALINAVVAGEKLISANMVRYLGGTTYNLDAFHNPMNEPSAHLEFGANQHFGQLTNNTSLYRECAQDIRFILSGRRILRTLIHTGHAHGLALDGDGPGTPDSTLQTWATEMAGANYRATGLRRISPSGVTPTGFWINPHLEHRQFHRYRRRN